MKRIHPLNYVGWALTLATGCVPIHPPAPPPSMVSPASYPGVELDRWGGPDEQAPLYPVADQP